ncbi:MAG: pilus assembly protein N-terminal domain-containing protein [Candidatus Acidiferrales bacterium]
MYADRHNRTLIRAGALALICSLFLFSAPGATAQQSSVRPANAVVQAAKLPQASVSLASLPPALQSQQASEVPQALHLLVGRSLVITSPTRIKRVSLADPAIAEAIVVSPNQVLVNGKAPGGVSLLLWDEADQSQDFEVSVDIDTLSLSQKIHDVFPNEPVQIETSKDVVMLSGRVSSTAVADKILEVVKNVTPKVTSLMEVPPPPTGEILLEVKFAEVDRTAITQLGINILSLPGAKNVGTLGTEQFSPPAIQGNLGAGANSGTTTTTTGSTSTTATNSTTLALSDLLNIFLFRPDLNLAATIRALQEKNILEILAEPNLLTASGKDASFLAGGEFPFPVIQSTGGSGSFPSLTIQFKEFGVRLNFTPTLLENGMIHLKVKPEVSALDFANALTIQGFVIPALSTRRVESEMNLKDGQSFAIAGLVDNRVTEILEKVPGIGDLPIIGKLFRSKSITKSHTELLVLVTPRIVKPYEPGNAPAGPAMINPIMGPDRSGMTETPAPSRK